MKSLATEIVINAPRERVWGILTDFDNHNNWNPFIRSFQGVIREGARFNVTLQPPGSKPMTFRPKCLVLKENEEFRWLGHLGFRGLFDGEHIFELMDLGNDKTRLVHRENFRGMLVPLIWKSLEPGTREGFMAMNSSLKEMAEQTESAGV